MILIVSNYKRRMRTVESQRRTAKSHCGRWKIRRAIPPIGRWSECLKKRLLIESILISSSFENRFFVRAPSTKIIYHLPVFQYIHLFDLQKVQYSLFLAQLPLGQSTFAADRYYSIIPWFCFVHIIQHIIDSLIYLAFVFPPPSFFSSSWLLKWSGTNFSIISGLALYSCSVKSNSGGNPFPVGNFVFGSRNSSKNLCAHPSKGFTLRSGA